MLTHVKDLRGWLIRQTWSSQICPPRRAAHLSPLEHRHTHPAVPAQVMMVVVLVSACPQVRETWLCNCSVSQHHFFPISPTTLTINARVVAAPHITPCRILKSSLPGR
ncbi:uncharacterized protein LOC123520758 [Portunus trituberculatus]|uniref:uncharacterized protein LOC123520758 n=1 Tax=Portunus trituberculatus TaxID=210409 RepID=UPI001E1D11D1|nr:uncharacterized protein LOC123520758 [Portunus trituberculatus]